MGKIFVLMGKSASGKDAVYRNLLQDPQLDLKKVVLYTTRPKRQGEMEGRQYFFISDAAYEEMRKGGRIIEERSYETKLGVWHYFTADDGQIDLSGKQAYLMIATPEAFLAIRAYFGEGCVFPVLIQTDNGIRLERALRRERRQEVPRYDEMCRRFLADEEDFAEDRLRKGRITRIFQNDATLEELLKQVSAYIMEKNRGN